jgi:hypothetical protein
MLLMEDDFGFMDMSQYGHAELSQSVAPSVIQHQQHQQQIPQTVMVLPRMKNADSGYTTTSTSTPTASTSTSNPPFSVTDAS